MRDDDSALPQDHHLSRCDLRILGADWNLLRSHLMSGEEEHAALLLCGVREGPDSLTYLVQEVVPLADSDYVDRGALHLSVSPVTLARYAKQARLRGAAVVLVHSHPFAGHVVASDIDLATEADLCRRVLPARTGQPSGALVIGPGGVDARGWTPRGASAMDRIRVISDRVEVIYCSSHGVVRPFDPPRAPSAQLDGATARQELLWGSVGQQLLRGAHIVVVGCGGTGSHVIQQLAHLRVGRMTLIDPDKVEESNLSRLIGATPTDVGRPKVEILARHVKSINPSIEVTTIANSVLDLDPRDFNAADVIVCATDGHGSRSLLSDIAIQYLVPVVDLGVEVAPDTTFCAGGGVRVLRPGRGCLWCAQTISPALVREEYLTDDQRDAEAARGYIRGNALPAPSVVALNGVVASLAVLEVCQLLVGMLASGKDRLLYRAEQRRMTTSALESSSACHVCGQTGILARGDSVPIKTRWQSPVTRSG